MPTTRTSAPILLSRLPPTSASHSWFPSSARRRSASVGPGGSGGDVHGRGWNRRRARVPAAGSGSGRRFKPLLQAPDALGQLGDLLQVRTFMTIANHKPSDRQHRDEHYQQEFDHPTPAATPTPSNSGQATKSPN